MLPVAELESCLIRASRHESDKIDGVEGSLSLSQQFLTALESGIIRVASPRASGVWHLNRWVIEGLQWVNGLPTSVLIRAGAMSFFDQLPLQPTESLRSRGVRLVPPATVRRGVFLGPGVVVMPAFVNSGAWIGECSMIDNWVSLGHGVQIGRHVHVSVGAIVGESILESNVMPTIVEDNCFVGAGAVLQNGVVVEENSVIAMGVTIDRNTKIFDRSGGAVLRGRVPSGSVVVAGHVPGEDARVQEYGAIIVKRVDAATRARTAVNDLLRPDTPGSRN